METVTTFKEPFKKVIEEALGDAYSITWCGCHRIYILADPVVHEEQVKYGYTPELIIDKEESLNRLWEWWEDSCGLRFISLITGSIKEGTEQFRSIIEQFEYEEEDNG
jgi:hypothetical protein